MVKVLPKCSESNSSWLWNLFLAVLEQLGALTVQQGMQKLLLRKAKPKEHFIHKDYELDQIVFFFPSFLQR